MTAQREEPTSPFDMLGHHVVDVSLDNFPAILMGYEEHAHGCNHMILEPTDLLKNGSVDRSISVDEQRVQFVKFGPKRNGKIQPAATVLGGLYRHKINGFEGRVIVRTSWVNHKPTALLEPVNRGLNGELLDAQIFDEDMLELVEAGEPKYSDTYRKRMGMAPKPSPEQKKKGIGSAPQSVGRHSMFR